jgi:hypothetical protein
MQKHAFAEGNVDIAAVKGDDYFKNTIKAVEILGGMSKFVSKQSKVGLLINSPWEHPGSYVRPEITRIYGSAHPERQVVEESQDRERIAGLRCVHQHPDRKRSHWRPLYRHPEEYDGRNGLQHQPFLSLRIRSAKLLRGCRVSLPMHRRFESGEKTPTSGKQTCWSP